MKKSLLFSFFALLLATFGFGGISMADGEILYIGSHQVTTDETDSSCGAGGTYSYNQTTETLTFNDCILTDYSNGAGTCDNTVICAKNINLKIEGNLRIKHADNLPVLGISLRGNQTGSLTLDGNITSNGEVRVWDDLTINSGTLITSGSIRLNGGNLIIKSDVKRVETTNQIRARPGTITIENPLAIILGGEIRTGTNNLDHTIGASDGSPVVIAPVTKITNINISGVTNPVLGHYPVTGGITITSTPEGAINLSDSWWGDTYSITTCNPMGVCSAGRDTPYFSYQEAYGTKEYFLVITYSLEDGYQLADNITVTANGNGNVTITPEHNYVKITYNASEIQAAPAPTQISSISITGITLPVGGNIPTKEGIVSATTGITVSNRNTIGNMNYDMVRCSVDTNPELCDVDLPSFVAGTKYNLYIPFTVDDGYVLANSFTATDGTNNAIETDGDIKRVVFQYTATAPAAYTIRWLNYNGDALETDENVAEGTTPTYDGDTPTKAEDSSCTYTFDKWTPDIVAASNNATYTATFTCTAKQSSSSSSPSSSGGGGGGKTIKKDTTITETDKDTEKEDADNKEDNKNDNTPTYEQGDQSEVLDNGYTREFNNAYRFGLKYGITTMDDINKADMYGPLTRIAMDKMLVNYAINVLHMVPDTTREVPNFPDVDEKLNEEYGNAVTLGYQLGIMGINIEEFRPFDEVPRADFGTSLGRMLFGLADGEGLYYEPHLKMLKERGIITNDDPELKELRGYVMLMLMRSAN